jgi:hypothetical protein
MNTRNFRLLVSRLETMLDDPKQVGRFNMSHFGRPFNTVWNPIEREEPICKTTACLAGESVLATGSGSIIRNEQGFVGGIEIPALKNLYTGEYAILHQARKDLGLTLPQTDRLFFFKGWARVVENGYSAKVTTGWPKNFTSMYNNAKTQQGRIYAAIRRVEFFIKTRGTDKV